MPTADQNLLLGLTALQTDFINREMLIEAMLVWKTDKRRSVLDILLDQGRLNRRQVELLENLTEEHIRKNGGTAEQGLVALSSFSTVLPLADRLDDTDIHATIAAVKQSRLESQSPKGDDFATTAPKAYGQPLGQQFTGGKHVNNPAGHTKSERSRFRILRMHARGGLGEVYLAEDEELHRNVALKEIISAYADAPENRQRFLVEAEITGRLQHPGIVPVYGLGIYPDGRPFYAMRFIEGDNLLTGIRSFHHQAQSKPWVGDLLVSFRELLGRFMDVCDAMQFAHERHVLHRDLKPQNIMLGEHGETLVVDWGLAKPLYDRQASPEAPESAIIPVSGSASGSEREGSVLGTPDYMPPEQAGGRLNQLSVQSDIYSLGATLFHLLTNQPPFQPKTLSKDLAGKNPDHPKPRLSTEELLQKVRAGEFDPPVQINPKIGQTLSAICMKAMALRPENRYESVRELKRDIQRWLADEPVSAMPERLHDKVYRWFRRHKQLSLLGGASLATIAIVSVIAAVAVSNSRDREIRTANISLYSAQLDGALATRQSNEIEFDDVFFRETFDPILQRLNELDPLSASRYELRAIQESASDIRSRLTSAILTDNILSKISADIQSWAERRRRFDDERLPATEDGLRQLLENRRATWNPLPPLAAKAMQSAFQNPDSFQLSETGQLVLQSPPSRQTFHQLAIKQLPDALNHEISVRFSIESLNQPAIAISLNPQKSNSSENQYQAILCVNQFKPNVWSNTAIAKLETLAQAASQGSPVRLLLARGRNTLSEAKVNLGLGEVVLRLRREDDRLRAIVEPSIGDKQQVEYEDFLTLAHTGLPGIWFGPKTSVTEIQLAYRTRPLEQSPIEAIKNHINALQYDQALEMLSLQTGGESDYLRSLCQTQVKDRLELLDFVLAKAPRVDSSGVVLDRWHLPAMIDAIRLNREENNEERFRDLILKLKFYYGTSIDNVATRVPDDLRRNLIAELRKQGGRWRISTQTDIDAPMLDTAVHLDSMLQSDPVVKRATRWRRCDAWRATGRHDDANRDLKKLLIESLADANAAPGEAANLITDICWVKLANNKFNEVETFLAEISLDLSLSRDSVNAIHLESARLAANQGRFEEAAGRLDDLLKDDSNLRVAQHIDACFVAGFVQLDLNNQDRAQELWRQGMIYRGEPIKLRNDNASTLHGTEAVEHQCIVTLYGTLASLTNTVTGEVAKEGFDAQIPKDGLSGNAAIDIVESMFPLALIEGVASAIYRSERGTAIARRRAYHQHDLAPYFTEPIRLLVFEGVVVKHLEEFRDNTALMDDIWNACDQLFLTYNSKGISEQEDMKAIVSLWAGQAGLETWQSLEPKVTRDVSAGLAILAGKAHFSAAKSANSEALRIMHTRNARTMLLLARDHRGATDNFITLADQLLAEIPENE
ncbi:MAG TPA: hypothetical protein DDZ51_11490 [Planctomycetaceae bacterium]|nr:hypothetical protein [Planctomycetaceae bacterium]